MIGLTFMVWCCSTGLIFIAIFLRRIAIALEQRRAQAGLADGLTSAQRRDNP